MEYEKVFANNVTKGLNFQNIETAHNGLAKKSANTNYYI